MGLTCQVPRCNDEAWWLPHVVYLCLSENARDLVYFAYPDLLALCSHHAAVIW